MNENFHWGAREEGTYFYNVVKEKWHDSIWGTKERERGYKNKIKDFVSVQEGDWWSFPLIRSVWQQGGRIWEENETFCIWYIEFWPRLEDKRLDATRNTSLEEDIVDHRCRIRCHWHRWTLYTPWDLWGNPRTMCIKRRFIHTFPFITIKGWGRQGRGGSKNTNYVLLEFLICT